MVAEEEGLMYFIYTHNIEDCGSVLCVCVYLLERTT